MIRKILFISVILTIISSCGNGGKKEISSSKELNNETVSVEFASLVADPSAYVGKTVSVEGKVVHVCTMSGKKMFITGDNPDLRLYVQAGEQTPKFPVELLGSEIVVEGTIRDVAASGMEGEGCMNSHNKMAGNASDSCETEKALARQTALADLMMVYNKHSVVK